MHVEWEREMAYEKKNSLLNEVYAENWSSSKHKPKCNVNVNLFYKG